MHSHFTLLRRFSLPLLASFMMNLALLAALIVLWQGRREQPALTVSATSVQALRKSNKVKTPAAKAAAFHWRLLDAPDFTTFVKNLRAIGCPELTIRDIVVGELMEIYEEKRQAVAATASGALLAAEISKLQTEQTQLLAHLTVSPTTTIPPVTVAAVQSTPTATSGSKPDAPAGTVNQAISVPAAFTYGTTASTALTQDGSQVMLTSGVNGSQLPPAATTALQQMQSEFVAALGDTVRQPDSPLYRQRWNTAQRDSDERFSSLFGGDAFISTQIEAVHAAAAAGK